MRPLPLVEVQPSERAQRHAVEGLGEFAPMVQILDAPVPQMVDYVAQALRLLGSTDCRAGYHSAHSFLRFVSVAFTSS